MLEDEFKELLHHIGLALGIVGNHPDPDAYAANIVAAHESVSAEVKVPDQEANVAGMKPQPAGIINDPSAGDPVLTDGTQWPVETKVYADGSSATGPVPLPDHSPAEQDAAGATKENALAAE